MTKETNYIDMHIEIQPWKSNIYMLLYLLTVRSKDPAAGLVTIAMPEQEGAEYFRIPQPWNVVGRICDSSWR